jgi:mono/diheme cytochrome c family protein
VKQRIDFDVPLVLKQNRNSNEVTTMGKESAMKTTQKEINMKKGIRNFVILATAVLGLSLTACGTGTQVDLSTVTPAQIQAYASALTPAQLKAYTAALTPAQIQTIGGSLTIAQLQAIAPFLASVTSITSGTTATPDGTALYTSNCAGCHGPLATSSKLGATTARIQSAVAGNIGGMGSLTNTLTLNQIQAIATALTPASSVTPPTTGTGTGGTAASNGTALYTTDCAGCHSALATSAKLGATTARIQSAISANTGGMGSLSSLSAADIQAISTALAGTGTTTGTTPAASDGATLFSTYCASCHSSMGSTSLSTIQSNIKSQSRMNSLSSLTSAQLQSISIYLSTAGGSGGSGGGGD